MSLYSNYFVVLVKSICITATKNGDVMVGAELNDTTKIFKTLKHEVNFQSLMDMLMSTFSVWALYCNKVRHD